jgi:hypothetical protein
MACNEIAGLRLALMNVLGRDDQAERQHDLAEAGKAATEPGPICSLIGARDLHSTRQFFRAALADLDARVARTRADDPQLPYLQTLVVLTKKIELDLDNQISGLERLYSNLDEMHDFVHEIYPGD